MDKLTQLPQWVNLKNHYQTVSKHHLRELFANDPQRFQNFSLRAGGLLLDYSKNRIVTETIDLLCQLAIARKLPEKIVALFHGEPINLTENHAALHTALRDSTSTSLWLNQKNILLEIRQTLEKMRIYAEKIQQKKWLGYNGSPITDVVNIGIGGSDLGPMMACEALAAYSSHNIRCHFVSNADSASILTVLKTLHPSSTLFIISSKSFTSKETLLNAKTAREWFKTTSSAAPFENHFLAVTANPERAIKFGIYPEHIFAMWDFVGGRYSVWSAIGLPIALSLGMHHFEDFLAGAQAMDQHFFSADLKSNMPVLLGLLSIWYINFFGVTSQAILPYCEALKKLPAYLQQTEMESNGKSVTRDGKFIRYLTSPVIFGEAGTNSQHAFHQMLHQGTQMIPVDFILPLEPVHKTLPRHQDLLVSSCLSQSRALMLGKSVSESYHELLAAGYTKKFAKQLAPHKTLPGNRPSNTIVLPKLTPYSLGALLALYEHKIFVQSVIWDINCFDQWGIELGKQMTDALLVAMLNKQFEFDESTNNLLQLYVTTHP